MIVNYPKFKDVRASHRAGVKPARLAEFHNISKEDIQRIVKAKDYKSYAKSAGLSSEDIERIDKNVWRRFERPYFRDERKAFGRKLGKIKKSLQKSNNKRSIKKS